MNSLRPPSAPLKNSGSELVGVRQVVGSAEVASDGVLHAAQGLGLFPSFCMAEVTVSGLGSLGFRVQGLALGFREWEGVANVDPQG